MAARVQLPIAQAIASTAKLVPQAQLSGALQGKGLGKGWRKAHNQGLRHVGKWRATMHGLNNTELTDRISTTMPHSTGNTEENQPLFSAGSACIPSLPRRSLGWTGSQQPTKLGSSRDPMDGGDSYSTCLVNAAADDQQPSPSAEVLMQREHEALERCYALHSSMGRSFPGASNGHPYIMDLSLPRTGLEQAVQWGSGSTPEQGGDSYSTSPLNCDFVAKDDQQPCSNSEGLIQRELAALERSRAMHSSIMESLSGASYGPASLTDSSLSRTGLPLAVQVGSGSAPEKGGDGASTLHSNGGVAESDEEDEPLSPMTPTFGKRDDDMPIYTERDMKAMEKKIAKRFSARIQVLEARLERKRSREVDMECEEQPPSKRVCIHCGS